MRIRKRTPARAASPALSPSPPPPPPLVQQPKEMPREEEEEDDAVEKRVILVAGPGGQGEVARVVPDAAKNSPTDGAPEPEDGAAAARCSRNDGKRWRCKNAAVPGSPFCDRHVSWSTRQRQPRPRQQKKNRGGVVEVEPLPEEEEKEAEDKDGRDGSAGPPQLVRGDDGGVFYYYGGFQPGGRKRPRGGGPGPAA